MASIEEGGGGGGHKKAPGVKKAKKLSTRVDMTPMCDLGFLLITFFIFTTTMQSPTTMDLNMPKDTEKKEEQTEVKQSGALTIMLGKNNSVYYYEGQLDAAGGKNFTPSNFKEIRTVIINKRKSVVANHVHDEECPKLREKAKEKGDPDWENACKDRDFVVVIKPDKDASYKSVVDILDEMTINKVKRFAMIKISDSEYDLIKATESSNGVN